jgi:hypothetical protein
VIILVQNFKVTTTKKTFFACHSSATFRQLLKHLKKSRQTTFGENLQYKKLFCHFPLVFNNFDCI